MPITQETANLIDTLATAAAKVGSTEASKQLNLKIVEILGEGQDGVVEAMRQDVSDLKNLLNVSEADNKRLRKQAMDATAALVEASADVGLSPETKALIQSAIFALRDDEEVPF